MCLLSLLPSRFSSPFLLLSWLLICLFSDNVFLHVFHIMIYQWESICFEYHLLDPFSFPWTLELLSYIALSPPPLLSRSLTRLNHDGRAWQWDGNVLDPCVLESRLLPSPPCSSYVCHCSVVFSLESWPRARHHTTFLSLIILVLRYNHPPPYCAEFQAVTQGKCQCPLHVLISSWRERIIGGEHLMISFTVS